MTSDVSVFLIKVLWQNISDWLKEINGSLHKIMERGHIFYIQSWIFKAPLQCNSMSLFVCYTAISYLSLTNSGDLFFLCFVLLCFVHRYQYYILIQFVKVGCPFNRRYLTPGVLALSGFYFLKMSARAYDIFLYVAQNELWRHSLS